MSVCTATYHYNCLHILNIFYTIFGLIFVLYNVQFNFFIHFCIDTNKERQKAIEHFLNESV